MIEQYDVLEQWPFLSATRELSRKATDRHWVKAMIWYPDTPTLLMADILKKTARYGVDVRAWVDSFSLMTTDFQNNLFQGQRSRKRQRATLAMLQGLRDAGVRVNLLNKPNLVERFIPQIGRDHQKAEIIDGMGFLMGFNFTDANFIAFDLAIALTDPRIVEKLSEEMVTGNKNDCEVSCTDETSLLIDRGKMGQSIILDRAKEMVGRARNDVLMVSVFCPNGELGHRMSRANRRGVNVETIASKEDWVRRAPLYQKLIYKMGRLEERLMQNQVPTKFYGSDIHAKFLIVDNKVLFGSHNFAREGVWAGTREIALFSTNPTLAANLRRYVSILDYYGI